MEWCGVFMMGLWASGLRSLRPLASTHSVPRLTTPSFSPHINPFRKNSKLKQNILWFGLSFVQISCRKIRSFPFLVDFHSFLPKRARKYHTLQPPLLSGKRRWRICSPSLGGRRTQWTQLDRTLKGGAQDSSGSLLGGRSPNGQNWRWNHKKIKI